MKAKSAGITQIIVNYVDLDLDLVNRPLEFFGAVVGGAIGGLVGLKYKAIIVTPTIAAIAYSGLMNHKPGSTIKDEVIQTVATDALKGATGAIVLGAKLGSYVDDAYNTAYSFVVENNMSEKAWHWYNHTVGYTSQAKSSAYKQFIKTVAFTYTQIYGKPKPESAPEAGSSPSPAPEAGSSPSPAPEAGSSPSPAPTPVNDETVAGRISAIKEEVMDSFNQYHELYNDAWKWMFGADQAHDL